MNNNIEAIKKAPFKTTHTDLRIKTKEIEHAIRVNLLNYKPVLFFGRPGIGKTEEIVRVINTIVEEKHYFNIDGTQTKYEAIEGLNYIIDGKMYNAPLPQIAELEKLITSEEFKNKKDKTIFVFIDEMSSFDPGDQRVLLNIINERRTTNGFKLPKETMFILAANPSQEQAGFAADAIDAAVHPVEEAVKTRCAVYAVDYNVGDFLEYANEKDYDEIIISTLIENKEIFTRYTQKDDDYNSIQTVVPRTLSSLNDLLVMANKHNIVLSDTDFAAHVGEDARLFYRNYSNLREAAIDFRTLLSGDEKARTQFDKLDSNIQNMYIVRNIKSADHQNIVLAEYDDVLYDIITKSFSAEYGKTLATIQYKFLDEAYKKQPNTNITEIKFNNFGPKVMSWLKVNKALRDGEVL